MAETSPVTVDGILLTRDLMFTSKVTSTASSLGFRIDVVGTVEALPSQIASARPRAVFLDLSMAEVTPAEVVNQLPAGHRPLIIAFGSHVDTARLQSAVDAGVDEVMPRSKFSGSLPELLQRVLG